MFTKHMQMDRTSKWVKVVENVLCSRDCDVCNHQSTVNKDRLKLSVETKLQMELYVTLFQMQEGK